MHSADDLPPKRYVFDYWKDRLGNLGFFIDWGEPGCWACRFQYGTKYDIKRSDACWEEILRCWDDVPLQRCHIIPRSLGGADEVDNIFLMCRECHDLAPNTSIPSIFFEWARAQSSHARESFKIQAAFDSFGIDPAAQADMCETMVSHEFWAWLSGKFGLHWPQSRYAALSSRLTPATMVGLAVYFERINRASSP